jgi:hypothetical protein
LRLVADFGVVVMIPTPLGAFIGLLSGLDDILATLIADSAT